MDVYDVSDDLVKKLNDWKLISIISGKFNELKENHSKVNFVEHALIDFKYIEKILLNVKLREEKCNKRSSEYRMLGNEQFSLKNKKYFQVSKCIPRVVKVYFFLIYCRHWNCITKAFVFRNLGLRIFQ